MAKIKKITITVPIYLYNELQMDAGRYCWLAEKYAQGEETYLACDITSKSQLDAHIDRAASLECKAMIERSIMQDNANG